MKVKFDVLDKIYPTSPYCKISKNGMVSTGNYLASQAGLTILQKGGNAVDAAIATAAVLTVVEPMSNGIGSDAFAIVWMNNKIYGLNASGKTASNISADKIIKLGHKKMPKSGWIPVMIPGSPKAWADLNSRFGKLTLIETLLPAIEYAEKGFPISPAISFLWKKYVKKHKKEYSFSKEFDEWFKVFTKNGRPYKFGETFKNPFIAKSLRLIGETNSKAFYEGEIAEEFIKENSKYNGFFTKYDLESYSTEWVEPISINYKGYDILEMPPNGQGLIALMALNILKNINTQNIPLAEKYHYEFEAMKLAFKDGINYIADQNEMKVNYQSFLTNEYGKNKANEIKEFASSINPINISKSGTVYLCTADKDGNMVSYIQSNYQDFGSGIVLKNYGISLQNRGADFSLNPNDINYLKPGIKSYHTIIPGFLMKKGKPVGPFGVMGGYMQPQGHVQILRNIIDYSMNPQSAIDKYRWQWTPEGNFIVEPDFPENIIQQLIQKGHKIIKAKNKFSHGRAQIIMMLNKKTYLGACESRTDSGICCW